MFTKNKDASPGRPRGRTAEGDATRARLYAAALDAFRRRGYDQATMREIADDAGVSASLLYKYFPSKRAIVLELYEELTAAYVARIERMRPGSWRDRFLFALEASLAALRPHRDAIAALLPVLVGDGADNVFAPESSPSRLAVQGSFTRAVTEARDAPDPETAAALGRLLYVMHLGVLLWWILDKSPDQRATDDLVKALHAGKPLAAFALHLPYAKTFVGTADALCRQALFGEAVP